MLLPLRVHPHGQAFAHLWGECSCLRSSSLPRRRSLREHDVGWERRRGRDGRESPVLSCGIPVCPGRDRPSVSILLCSTGKHVVLNTCSLSFPFSASALCACASCQGAWIHPGYLYKSVSGEQWCWGSSNSMPRADG